MKHEWTKNIPFFSCLVLSSAQLPCSAWSPLLTANIFRRRLTFEIIVLNLTTGQLQLQRFLRTNRNCLRRFVSQFSDRQQHVLKLTIATWNNSVKLTKHLHAIDLIQFAIRYSWILIHLFLLNHLTRLFDPIDKPNTNETPMLVQTMSPMKLLTQTM